MLLLEAILIENIDFSISPKKTIEGCIIGVLVGTFIGSMFYLSLIGSISVLKIIFMSLIILTILSEMGDLVFSAK